MSVPKPIDIIYFAVWLQLCGNAPTYIRQQLAGIVSILEANGIPNPTKGADGEMDPRLRRVLRGIKKKCSRATEKRLPVTTSLLKRVLQAFDAAHPGMSARDRAGLKSAMSLAVHALLRIGEITTDTVGAFDANKVLLGTDVTIGHDAAGRPRSAKIRITAGKSDVEREGTTIALHATDLPDCPVWLLHQYLLVRGPRDATPLYTLGSGYLTRPKFTAALRRTLDALGFDSKLFSGHSMRGGGAISLACAGHDLATISIYGRWRSLAVLRCLREMPDSRARSLQLGMAQIVDGDIQPQHVQVYEDRFG